MDIEAEAAQNAMTAIIKAFNMDVSQVESVMDKLVTVGNNFPISVSQIAEGMNNASSMLAVAGNSFEESVALLTAANTTIQNVSKASTGLRTIAARIRKTTTGEDDEGEIVEEAKYQEMINALTKHHVDLVDQATGEYRKTYDIIRDISRVWDDLTSMEQAAVIEALAGTRQQNIFTSLVTQFQEAEGAMEKMKNSAGELQEAYDIRMSSIQSHVQQLKDAFDSLSMNVVDSDVAKGLVDVLTNIVSLVDTIISKIGVGGLLGGITAITVGVKALTGTLSAGLVITITNLLTTVGEFAQFFIPALMGLSSAAAGLAAIVGVLGLVAVGFIAVNAAVKAYREAHPTLEMLKEDAQEAQKAASDLGEEVSKNKDRIKELTQLKTDGTITAAQEAELANLQAENAKLEEQLELLRQIAQYKQGQVDDIEGAQNRENAETFFSTGRTHEVYDELTGEKIEGVELRSTTGMGAILNAIDDYNSASLEYAEARDALNAALEKAKSEGTEIEESDREKLASDIDTARKKYEDQAQNLRLLKDGLIKDSEVKGITSGQRAGYHGLIGKLTRALGEASTVYDKLSLRDLSETQIEKLSGVKNFEEFKELLGTDEELTRHVNLVIDQVTDENGNTPFTDEDLFYFNLDRDALEKQMTELAAGGNVDLTVRPVIDTKYLLDAGWEEAGEGAATLFSSTFTNGVQDENGKATAGTKASLFTPIFTDSDGKVHVLSPEELQAYAEDVMSGIKEDDLHLKISGDFEGEDAIEKADELGERLSVLQGIYYDDLISSMEGIANSAARAAATVESLVQKITTVKERIDTLKSISSEAFSDAGLSMESVTKFEEIFKDLDGFNPATFFDATANGIRVNAKELENFTDQYYEMQRSEFNNIVRQKMRDANDLGMRYLELSEDERQAAEGQQLLEEWQGLQTQIEKAQQARAEIDGMTSAYMRFLAAQSTPNENDQYLKLASYFDTAKKQFEMGFGYIDDVTEFLDTIFEDRSGELADNFTAYNELFKEIGNSGHSISDFFTPDDSQGVINFLDTVQSVLGSDYVKKIGEGDYEFDFGGDKLFKVADELNLSAEAIQILEHAMVAAGFDVKFDTMADEAARAAYNLKNMGELRDDFFISDIDTSNVDAAISEIQGIMEQWRNGDTGKIDLSVEGASEAEVVLRRLYDIKNQVPTIEIPVEVQGTQAEQELLDIQGWLEELGAIQTEIEIRTALGEDAEGLEGLEASRDEIVQKLSGTEIATKLGLETEPADTAYKSWKLQVESGTVTATLKSEMQSDGVSKDGTANVTITANANEADSERQRVQQDLKATVYIGADPGGYNTAVASIMGSYLSKVIHITTIEEKITMPGGSGATASGTAHASGTAYKGGNWGAKKTETALVGEIGPELRVRDGQWELLGEDSAEMASIRKGDIIFNAEQTRQILKNGKIVNGMRRGVAYLKGTAYDAGSGAVKRLTPSKSSSGGGGGGGKGSKDSGGDDSGKIDWIEVLIDRLTFAIDNLAKVAQSNLKALATRVSATNREIDKTSEKLNVMRQAFDRYQEELSTIELDSAIKGKIQEGAIDISSYDDDTQNKIKEYQQWYEKALDCWGAIEDLHQALGELYMDNFNNAQKDFENQLTRIERTANMAQKDLDMARKKGYMDSAVFYETMAESQAQSIDKLNVELQDLTFYFEQAMGSHEIEEGSEAWYEMQEAIDDVKEALADANIQLVDYQRTLMKLNWDYFDYAHDRLKQISQEANFLIDVMSNDKLFQDNGKFSELGEATAAMRAVNYNEFMLQADEYNKERLKIERQLVNDPYDKELIARREALLQLQQQSIQAAESEKDAVANLVEQGINMELEALQELINTYKESLDSAKDLYEYQKKVTEKTADIASIQKQLSAYTNDTSEETRAKVQKLQQDLKEAQTDLQDVERDQNINDQKKLLDDLYTEYEDFLNARLDDVDLLMRDIIAGANENMAEISTTIREVGAEVGYTITDAMQNILHGDFANYDHAFEGESSVAVTLGEIYELVAAMARASGAVKAYATGGLVDYTGMAAVHGSKSRPELMLNANDTENFLAAAAMLRDTRASSTMSDMSAVHSIGPAIGGVNIGQISLGIQIDHVQDYNDLITQMRNDPKFERLIGAMTLDRAVGKSSFGKNRIVF